MNISVFDLHCDTASGLAFGRKPLRENDLHIDLTRASVLENYVQCFACFTTTEERILRGRKPQDDFQRQLDTIILEMERNPDKIRQAFSPEDILENQKNGLMSGVLTIEGPAGFGFQTELLETLHKIGFRITSLGWNEKNCLIGSHKTGGGLTDMGAEYVKEAQRLGMLIDVSHCSDEGFWDIMKVTNGPVIATHSNSRAVCDHSRNLTDDMFRAICETGGVAGFNQCLPFVGKDADLDTICDHIFHFMELDPSGKHIALGGDLDGCDAMPKGFDGIQSYPAMAQRLLERGLGEETLRDIFWNNAMGVFLSAVRHN